MWGAKYESGTEVEFNSKAGITDANATILRVDPDVAEVRGSSKTTNGQQNRLKRKLLQCPHCIKTFTEEDRLNGHIEVDHCMEWRTVRVYLCFLFLTIIGAINGCRQSVQYLQRLKIKVAQMEEWTQILLYFGKDLVRLLEEAGNQETCQQGLLASTAKSRLSISWNSSSDISGSSFQHFFKMDLYLYFKYHILIVLLLLILVLTADWAPCGDGCQRRGGHWGGAAGRWSGRPRGAPPPSRSTCRPRYNLQFHPARGKSLILVLLQSSRLQTL